jgi:type III pantothenate kinase
MLLAVDVGNTNTVLGLYRLEDDPAATTTGTPKAAGERVDLAAHWRITTHRAQTVGIKTGMQVLVDNPTELGADRLADCIAAFERYGGPCIVVDFGTATKFEVISERGEYLGGAIAPGLGLSAEALFSRAARLSRVDIKRPAKVIGTNTVAHLQSGLYYGYIGLVDGLLERIFAELGQKPQVIATGGLARMIAADSRYIAKIDDLLTIDGLRILFERNRAPRPRSRPS